MFPRHFLSPLVLVSLLSLSFAARAGADPLEVNAIPARPLVAGRPLLHAVRASSPPVIDGQLDDTVWISVPPAGSFIQKFPDEGRAPKETTALRVAYDDDALYVGIACEQRLAPLRRRLTRRDRVVESDSVSVTIDTRRDGTSGFEFSVNAAGVLIDSIRFNDTQISSDWDENWDARTAITADGWSVELRIPLRILRFASVPLQSWGFQARRYVSDRHETDEWAFIPRSSAGEVSQYGQLDNLQDLKAGHALELTPFLKARVRRRDVQEGQLASGADLAGSGGLDLKWHPSQALTLDAAVLPDFAEVEADQLILHLTNLEINFPEKRRFFLEGIDTFSIYNWNLLYTRRIGRAAPPPVLRDGEKLVDQPEPAPIYAAVKLTGQPAASWQVGALAAVTGRSDVDVQLPDGSRTKRLADPLAIFGVLRAKRALGDNGHFGVLATSVVRADVPGDHPPQSRDPDSENRFGLCPDGRQAAPGQRCANDAHVAGLDWRWVSPSGDYSTVGQAVTSVLHRGPDRAMPDGTVIEPGQIGVGLDAAVTKQGGAPWLWNFWGNVAGRRFEINDVGFAERGNQFGTGGMIGLRTLRPWLSTLESQTRVEWVVLHNMDRLRLERSLTLASTIKFANFWTTTVGVTGISSRFDDRELGDGAALQRASGKGATLTVESDPTARVWLRLETSGELLRSGKTGRAQLSMTLHALPQLDFELIPQVLATHGEPRFAALAANGDYLFGRLDAKSAGAVLRASYTFTPRLTLQTYAQLFLASKHYDDLSRFDRAAAGPRPAIRLADLQPGANAPDSNPDAQEGALNANVVLRWEFRPGSLLYLVYSRSQAPDLALMPGQVGKLDFRALRRGPAADVVLLKLSLWWT